MTTQILRLRCACGWETSGPEPELVAATQEHGRRVHNMEATRDEVLAMVIRDDKPPTEGRVADGSAPGRSTSQGG